MSDIRRIPRADAPEVAFIQPPDEHPVGAGPDLKRRRWRWTLYVGCWTFIGLFFISPIIANSLANQHGIRWGEVLSEFLNWYLWGLLFPLIWWVSRRFSFERRKLASRIPIHLASGLIVSLIYVTLMLLKNSIVTSFSLGKLSFDLLKGIPGYLLGGFEWFLVPYFGIVAFIHAVSYYEKYRERQLKTTRLEAQLALAHLEVLKMQLQPHFLFNTLNAISALMHRDVDAADRMISLLSDLLRLSLEKDNRHQVSLQSEIEFLNRYLAIEKIRFRDRLKIEEDIEAICMAAQVPRLILQPLVENSIKHGIAMRSAAGRISIRARRLGERLNIQVSDDGPGLPSSTIREGVGLANTRARLKQIYGDDHHFELRNGHTDGVHVHLEIPFEENPRIAEGAA
ncbi:MAG: histidine kinase [Acidobacteriota bacterium]